MPIDLFGLSTGSPNRSRKMRLGEGVEEGEGRAALGPQRLRPIQHLRDPALLV